MLTARLARLAAKLQEYQCTVEYVPGRLNVHTDCLSRLPLPDAIESNKCNEDCDVVFTIDNVVVGVSDQVISEKLWHDAMLEDGCLRDVVKFLQDGWPEEIKLCSELNSYFKIKD